jgi:hypothetical protein
LGSCIADYSDVLPLNIVLSESFTRHDLPALLATHFVGDHIEGALNDHIEGGFGYTISSSAGIFITELTVLFVTLRHSGEVIQPPEKCLILTDSLSSVKALLSRKISHRTHPLVYECKQMCSNLLEDGVAGVCMKESKFFFFFVKESRFS